jgi:hypothetical protein
MNIDMYDFREPPVRMVAVRLKKVVVVVVKCVISLKPTGTRNRGRVDLWEYMYPLYKDLSITYLHS